MITLHKLKTYEKYNGDGDDLARGRGVFSKEKVSSEDFSTIEDLIQDARLIQQNNAGADYTLNAINKIANHCENQAVIDYLYHLADKRNL